MIIVLLTDSVFILCHQLQLSMYTVCVQHGSNTNIMYNYAKKVTVKLLLGSVKNFVHRFVKTKCLNLYTHTV